jgi:Autographiviridae endonuclease
MSRPFSDNDIAKFWSLVNKTEYCWLWTKGKDKDGYGVISLQRRSWRTHRAAYMIAYEDPGNLYVLHRCDNPSCVRPDHLFLGTNDDNMADMRAKGRSQRGQRNGRHVFTPEQVREIRKRGAVHRYGLWTQLAREYEVSPTAIKSIVIRKNWGHVE